MDGAEFEKWTARLLARSGCRDVRVVGRSGDMGADVVAISPSGGRLVVQCKRYTDKKVGSGSVQSFSGTAWHIHKASLAMMVTTTAFTKPAQEVAARIPGMVLIDRSALAEWARTDVLPGIDGAVRRSPASA
ncbi:restriction endonuclease [Saccharothrix sp.]|uniref:restriction endonuclease n=1 Tax=Saccharothrix sp. TaxID=1873460 RepID=UPI0035C86A7B